MTTSFNIDTFIEAAHSIDEMRAEPLVIRVTFTYKNLIDIINIAYTSLGRKNPNKAEANKIATFMPTLPQHFWVIDFIKDGLSRGTTEPIDFLKRIFIME